MNLFSRTLTLLALTSAPLLTLAGCGGGSGGGSGGGGTNGSGAQTSPTASPGETPAPTASGQGVLFSDDFSSPNFDFGKWGRLTGDAQLQRTLFGGTPTNRSENGTTFTRITLDSYNPDAPGQLFRGTDIYSFNSFAVGNGLEVEARLRGPNLPPGVLFAFFLIGDRYEGAPSRETYRKDEIDFEFLTAQTEKFAGNTRNRLYMHLWEDWNEARDGYDPTPDIDNPADGRHNDLIYRDSVDPNYDYANWNVYKIRWFPDRIEMLVNGRIERVEREIVAEYPMSLHFNFWAPTGNFAQAFSGNLPGPVDSPDNPSRRIYSFDVDYVRVTALSSSAGAARVAAPASKPRYGEAYRNR